jgi:hypothetical protein
MNPEELTDGQLRAEARRRGFELHRIQFSQAAQNAFASWKAYVDASTSF